MHSDSKPYFAALGQRLAQLRVSHGHSQGDVAKAVGVSQQAMCAYEAGERRPSILTLVKLARFHHVDFEDVALLDRWQQGPNRRLSPHALHNAERLFALSKTQQRFVTRIIDTLEARNEKH